MSLFSSRMDFLATTIFLIQTVVLLGSLVPSVPVSASADCSDGTFACLDGSSCYSETDRCDNIPDCSDRTDEMNCTVSCSQDEFHCSTEDVCYPLTYKCDGHVDCAGDSEEDDCDNVTCGLDSDFMCHSDKTCIVGALKCDGTPHCHDSSDESDCEEEEENREELSECDPEQSFDCTGDGSRCIALQKRCNGHEDCPNGEDETDALCSSNSSASRCSIHNGGCSHNCVATIHGHHCSCPEGFQLAFDRTTCEDIDECVEHACSHQCNNLEGGFECSCNEGYRLSEDLYTCLADGEEPELWATNGSNLVQYGLHSGDRKITNLGGTPHSIAYDRKNEKIFWIDSQSRTIYWSSKDGSPEVLISTLIEVPAALAYDWIHENLYWADAGTHARHTKIEVVTLRGEERWRTVVVSPPEVDRPKFMVVDPRVDQGYLYWAQGTSAPIIRRSGLDGSDPETIVTSDLGTIHGLTLDLVEDRLFWVDSKLNVIVSLGVHDREHNREVLVTFVEYPKHPIGIGVFEDSVYWADIEAKSVQKMYKFLREGEERPTTVLEHLTNPHSIEIYHKMKQPQGESYCGNNNGGCSHICLPSPHFTKFLCVCPLSTDKTKHYAVSPDNSSACQLIDGASVATTPPSFASGDFTSGASTRSQSNFINMKSLFSAAPTASGGLNTPWGAGGSTGGQSGSGEDVKSDKMWMYIGIAGAVGLLIIIILSILGYKLYARHVSKNLHFDNPVFEQKPLRHSERQADSKA